MRIGRFSLLVTLFSVFVFPIVAQQTQLPGTPAQSSGAQNQLPKERLRAVFQSLGWAQLAASGPIGVLANGTLTYYDPDGSASTVANVTIKCRGSLQYRIDVNEVSETHSTIVNGLGGVHIGADGKAHRLPASTAVSMQSPMFPFLSEALNPDSAESVVEDMGTQGVPAGAAQGLHVTIPPSAGFEAGLRSRSSEKTLWLSGDGTPTRIDFFRVAADNHYAKVPFSLLLSDYRKVAGAAVAFRQEEQLNGRTMYVLTLQDVRIGVSSGVTPSDFQAPAVVGSVR
jgi:hypothetical protein